jgi:Chaperone of endosialidase
MNKLIPLKAASQSLAYLVSASPRWRGPLLIMLALVCFGLSPASRAVTPAPDGGYPNGNTAEGTGALSSLSSGSFNTALGLQALFSDTTGGYNTGTGVNALYKNTTGAYNTADGLDALYNNTTGTQNTATGVNALFSSATASYNTADGVNALYSNTTGTYNTATGLDALYSNTTGTQNTANGDYALFANTTGGYNTAIGVGAMFSNTAGTQNTSIGVDALYSNTTGGFNTATGDYALQSNTTADGNTANGYGALQNNTGGFNIALGYHAGVFLTTGIDNIDIGNEGVAGDSETTRIGIQGFQTATFISGIYGVNEGGTISAAYINSNGQLGTQPPPSSRRFKKEIRPMDKVSEAILALKPVTFQYRSDNNATPQFGLIAEEVAQVNPDLVLRDSEGKVYTVRYEAVNAMLLNEFLKEHRKVQELEKDLRTTIAQQQKQIEVLTAGLQKVSDQLEVSKAAPQLVANNQ